MLEWLILAIVVPAVVVPVVLLAGFAGCDRVFGLHRLEPPPPVITVSAATGLDTIALAWTFGYDFNGFEIERTALPDETVDTIEVDSFSHADTGLTPGTIYLYRIRARKANDEYTGWSAPASAKTFSFQTTFEWKGYEEVYARDTAGWEGYCLVQRIEPIRLSKSGAKVRVTLRTSSMGGASIKRVYISRPSGDPAGDPFDSDADLTPIVTTPFVIAADTTTELPVVDYHLDEAAPLLIAVDFDAPLSAVRTTDRVLGNPVHVPPEEAQSFFGPATEAAAAPDRTGLNPTPGINLVYKIEVVAP